MGEVVNAVLAVGLELGIRVIGLLFCILEGEVFLHFFSDEGHIRWPDKIYNFSSL